MLRTGLRFWANFLNSAAGALMGGFGYWLFAHGPTPIRVAGFAAGVAVAVIVLAAGLVVYLRRDPAAEHRSGQTDIPTDTIRRRK